MALFVYGLEIPVKYKFIGPDKAINWKKTQVLNAVKVGFVVCKGVFVAYIFYYTNQCAFI